MVEDWQKRHKYFMEEEILLSRTRGLLRIRSVHYWPATTSCLCSCCSQPLREAFSEIGDIRSLIPDHVQMMALTATATKSAPTSICHKLGMIHPFVIAKPPNRKNIKYFIATPLCIIGRHIYTSCRESTHF